MLWPPPPDWAGVYEGACRLPELFEEFEEPELEEPELDEFDAFEEPAFDVPLPDDVLPDDVLPVPDAALEPDDELFDEVAVLCVEPGRTTATTPATATLAKLTVAVAVFSRRRPRSRSATARERSRAAPRRRSWLLILSVWHTQLYTPFMNLLRTLSLRVLCPAAAQLGLLPGEQRRFD
ncbi:MAG TPA: hypothetical protein VKG80_20045 [Trebonia sp.]|nr:hypothetical protein [Trebonia sp.]